MATKVEWGVRYVSTTSPNEGLKILGPFGEFVARNWLTTLPLMTNEDESPANVEVRLIKRTITIGDWEPTE